MFWIFVGIASLRQFQQISKTYVYEETTTKQNLSYMSIYLLSILYNSKFILMATNCLGTNAVVVTRVHCTELFCISLLKHMLWVFIRSTLSRCFYEYQQHMFPRNNKKKYYMDTPYNLELSLLTILFLILEQVHDAFILTLNWIDSPTLYIWRVQSDLGLHHLPNTLLRISWLQRVKLPITTTV